MSEQLTLLPPEPPTGAVAAWETLQPESQQVIQALLARLMRQIILAQRGTTAPRHRDD